MDSRQSKLLNLVIENHISAAEPIGSRFLVSERGLEWSEATVRNDLRALEEEGYLSHPHTSAGRLPTEKGFRFYVDNLDFGRAKISKKDNDVLGISLKKTGDREAGRKGLARSLAELSEETALLAFSPERIYYTGLSNLFAKPEFRELEIVADLSEIFDHCEQCLEDFFDDVAREPKFFIGEEHSFGKMLSVGAFRFGATGLLALLGPMRMNYRRNWGLMGRVKELLS